MLGNFLVTASVFAWSTFLVLSFSVIAAETPKEVNLSPLIPTDVDITAPEQADPLSGQDTVVKSPMAQVTSVSQLSDVQPTDWAFQALQSLVERYGCIAGYPNGTYRGNRAMTRYEFAAGLNACLDRINELIAAGTSDLVRKEDIATFQRLREEFATELATIKGRVDVLEARSAQLQANQFSTTTKLSGLAFINITTAEAARPVRVEGTPASITGPYALRAAGRDPVTNRPQSQRIGNPNTTLSELVWLNFNTSFTGKDTLLIQLAAGNANSPANQFASAGQYNTFGVPFTDATAGPNVGVNNVLIRELSYTFPIGKTIQVGVGPRLDWYSAFDNNRFTYFLTGASSYNSGGSTLLNTVFRGSGAIVQFKPSNQFQLNIGYLGENTEFLPSGLYNTSSDPTRGLFGGNYSATVELDVSPTKSFTIRFLYDRSRIQQLFGQVGAGGNAGKPLNGLADDGFGGSLRSATADTYEANFDWLITRSFGVFGRYSYGSTHLTPVNTAISRGDVNAQSVQGGLAFPDLGKEGALATLSYVIPFSVLDGRRFLIANVGDGGIENDFEATYYYPVTDNIAIVPAFYLITRANNFRSNPPIYVGNVRLQFSF